MDNKILLANKNGDKLIDLDELVMTLQCNEMFYTEKTLVKVFCEIIDIHIWDFKAIDFANALHWVRQNSSRICHGLGVIRAAGAVI